MSDSSDDEPIFDTPVNSEDDSSESGDDVFQYQAQKFQKDTYRSRNTSSPSPVKKRRTTQAVSGEDQLKRIERKKVIKNKELEEKVRQKIKEDFGDSDEESIVEIGRKSHSSQKQRNQDDSIIEILDDSPSNKVPAAASIQNQDSTTFNSSIELSSDDEDYPIVTNTPLDGASLSVLQRSRMAAMHLTQAQQYHAEDIVVDTREIETPVVAAKPSSVTDYQTKQPVKLGKALRLTCRSQIEVNGKKRPVSEKVYTIREKESFQVLFEKFVKENDLPQSARVTFLFDGMTLELSKTPSSYEMEDEDLIDVNAKANIIPSRAGVTTTTYNGPKIKIKLRRKVGGQFDEIELQMGNADTFQRLLDMYLEKQKLPRERVKLHFDGESLDLKTTPAQVDMESEDLIDVIYK